MISTTRVTIALEDLPDMHEPALSALPGLKPGEERRGAANLMLFNEILRAPKEIGAICPSSMRLGRVIASLIDREADGLVVELGAGTGAITESLLAGGVAATRLIVVEKSATLASYLARRFPQVCVLQGDAAELPEILNASMAIKTVVSGLPLRSLPRAAVSKIASTWTDQLAQDGRIIQFTYAPFYATAWLKAGLKRMSNDTVWGNFPPARVEVFSHG